MNARVNAFVMFFISLYVTLSGGSKNLKVYEASKVQCNLCGVEVSLKKLEQHRNLRCRACGRHHRHLHRFSRRNYKTVLCVFWNKTGRCQYGAGCHFAHGERELKRQRKVSCVQRMQQQRSKGKVAGGGAALKWEEQRRAADKVSDCCTFSLLAKLEARS